MAPPLQGKTVLVTGGARRIGAAIARRLHAAGANIAIQYRGSVDDARAIATELNARRTNSIALLQTDLTHTRLLGGLISGATASLGAARWTRQQCIEFSSDRDGEDQRRFMGRPRLEPISRRRCFCRRRPRLSCAEPRLHRQHRRHPC